MRLLLVTKLDPTGRRVYTRKWRPEMRVLVVSKLDRFARGVNTVTKLAKTGAALGHEVAVYGETLSDIAEVPYSLDVESFDFAIFVVYETSDFPDLPYLARLLDGMPKERRVIIDCCGRYNDTIRVDHDFNHLEKLDGHQGWEWVEGFQTISDRVLQPTLTPLRPDVTPFLFHAFDPQSVARPAASADEAGRSWSASDNGQRPYGVVYVGNNWQRWSQLRPFLEELERVKDEVGPVCLAGWDWEKRPDWAIELGLQGVDVDPALLERVGAEAQWPVPFDEVVDTLGRGRFTPIVHRPLFNHLGLVTNRTFETFCADTIPVLLLPPELVESLYGSDALRLVPGDDVGGHFVDALRRPEVYWDAVLATRAHLATHHSFETRFQELLAILEG
jgi:hypothetical protein